MILGHRITRTVLTALAAVAAGCSSVTSGIDSAIVELRQGTKTFTEIKDILQRAEKNLNDGVYKSQVEDIIGRTGQVAQLGVEGSVDFTRMRVIEDLESIKRSILGQGPPVRIPILANPKSPEIDFRNSSRSSLTVVGWNLDVAQKDPKKYYVVVKNAKLPDRPVDWNFVAYQGQYAVTINVGSSGIKLEHDDAKISFVGFDPVFEITVVNSNPPKPVELGVIAVPPQNLRNQVYKTEAGHATLITTDIFDHLADFDASKTAADRVVVGNKIDDHSTVRFYAPNGDVTFQEKIDNHSTIHVNAPGGVVTFNKEINGQSKLYITARRVIFRDKIDGGRDTVVDITITPADDSTVEGPGLFGVLNWKMVDGSQPSERRPRFQKVEYDGKINP